ncbi:MAG: dihydroorotate dehydrogenase [Acidimicrobiales bacterium]|nr:dihydroorotate dehydrogenase [Acidimicrobiales bacterium]RZV48734.1 MAG: dihydroorotate dehydrogenase [Acidimicrobiales bacterium]
MVDLSTTVGDLSLPNPVMTASGTAGHGAELASYFDLAELGALVVKSLSVMPWAGNPAPRVVEIAGGMMNSVGLQGPGVAGWIEDELPALRDSGARVVASIWGRTVEEYRQAADALLEVQDDLLAVEINVSCPNIEDRSKMFSHSAESASAVLEATQSIRIPRWAKLSPNVPDIAEIAHAVWHAGANAVTLTNTLIGIVLDPVTGKPVLGGGGGGVSGQAIRPVTLRAVYDVSATYPDLPIIGVGGIAAAEHAVQYLRAGASAVQVGTATFENPRATHKIAKDLGRWCREQGVERITDLIGTAHV